MYFAFALRRDWFLRMWPVTETGAYWQRFKASNYPVRDKLSSRGGFLKEINSDLLWQLFLDTGDPLCWMLIRRGREDPREDGKGNRTPFRR